MPLMSVSSAAAVVPTIIPTLVYAMYNRRAVQIAPAPYPRNHVDVVSEK